jgi:hypothetical protein
MCLDIYVFSFYGVILKLLMISLQNTDKPLVLPSSNKKNSNQSYVIPTAQVLDNTYELGISSISFASTKKPQVASVVVPVTTAPTLTKSTQSHELEFPQKDWICILYITFTLFLATCTIVAPSYTSQIAVLLCPLFTYTVMVHSFIGKTNKIISTLGLMIILFYPVVVVFNSASMLVTIFVMFMLFCGMRVIYDKYSMIQATLMLLIFFCTLISIMVYAVYPKTIYGAHAAFLCMCVMACTSVLLTDKGTYKLKFYPLSNVLPSSNNSSNDLSKSGSVKLASTKTFSAFIGT